MGCGKARFGQKGQKTPKIENFGLKVCSVGSRGDPRWELKATCTDLEATQNESSRQPAIGGWCPLSSYCGLPRDPREQTLRPKLSILGVFLASSLDLVAWPSRVDMVKITDVPNFLIEWNILIREVSSSTISCSESELNRWNQKSSETCFLSIWDEHSWRLV